MSGWDDWTNWLSSYAGGADSSPPTGTTINTIPPDTHGDAPAGVPLQLHGATPPMPVGPATANPPASAKSAPPLGVVPPDTHGYAPPPVMTPEENYRRQAQQNRMTAQAPQNVPLSQTPMPPPRPGVIPPAAPPAAGGRGFGAPEDYGYINDSMFGGIPPTARAQVPVGALAANAAAPRAPPFTMIMRPNAPAESGGRGGGGPALTTALDLSGWQPPAIPPAAASAATAGGGGGRAPAAAPISPRARAQAPSTGFAQEADPRAPHSAAPLPGVTGWLVHHVGDPFGGASIGPNGVRYGTPNPQEANPKAPHSVAPLPALTGWLRRNIGDPSGGAGIGPNGQRY